MGLLLAKEAKWYQWREAGTMLSGDSNRKKVCFSPFSLPKPNFGLWVSEEYTVVAGILQQ